MLPTPESFQNTLIKSVMNFKVVFQEAEEGGYIVSCPPFPDATPRVAAWKKPCRAIKEAIAGCLESLAA